MDSWGYHSARWRHLSSQPRAVCRSCKKKTDPAGPDRFSLERNLSLDIQALLSPQTSTRNKLQRFLKVAAIRSTRLARCSPKLPAAGQHARCDRVTGSCCRATDRLLGQHFARPITTFVTSNPLGVMLSDCLHADNATFIDAVKFAPLISKAKFSPLKRPVTSPLTA